MPLLHPLLRNAYRAAHGNVLQTGALNGDRICVCTATVNVGRIWLWHTFRLRREALLSVRR
jgi:hypothetical protein